MSHTQLTLALPRTLEHLLPEGNVQEIHKNLKSAIYTTQDTKCDQTGIQVVIPNYTGKPSLIF